MRAFRDRVNCGAIRSVTWRSSAVAPGSYRGLQARRVAMMSPHPGESAVVVNLADARTRRRIRQSIADAAASGSAEALRARRIRAAAFAFACHGPLERHAELAIYDEGCPAECDERDPAAVARIVAGLPRNHVPTAADLAEVFGVDAPSPVDAARFIVETGGDLYCRLHGVPCDS